MHFAFIFSEYITITSSKEALKVCELIFFQEIQAESSLTSNLPVHVEYFMAFDILLSTVFVK